MNTLKFKTNAKCGGCEAKINAELSKILSPGQWSVDLGSPEKTLTVTSNKSEAEIIAAVKTAGFNAEPIN